MKKVICKSGAESWQAKLQKIYGNFEHFQCYCDIYNVHKRLGYKTPKTAWKANPTIQASVIPSDLRKVKV